MKKNKKMFCPICSQSRDVLPCAHNAKVSVRNEIIDVYEELFQCQTCNELIPDPDSRFDLSDAALRLFREKYKMLMPEDIKSIRTSMGLTQQEFATFLGIGYVSVSRYENGDLQEKVHDNLLSLIKGLPSLQSHFNKVESLLPESLKLKISNFIELKNTGQEHEHAQIHTTMLVKKSSKEQWVKDPESQASLERWSRNKQIYFQQIGWDVLPKQKK